MKPAMFFSVNYSHILPGGFAACIPGRLLIGSGAVSLYTDRNKAITGTCRTWTAYAEYLKLIIPEETDYSVSITQEIFNALASMDGVTLINDGQVVVS